MARRKQKEKGRISKEGRMIKMNKETAISEGKIKMETGEHKSERGVKRETDKGGMGGGNEREELK